MSTMRVRPIAVAPSRRGLPPIRKMPPASRTGGRRPMRSARTTARSPPNQSPHASTSTSSPAAHAPGAQLPPRRGSWLFSPAASSAGWRLGPRRRGPAGFDTFTAQALDAHRVYVVEVRHPVEVTGGERPHLVQWLSKRLDYELRIPELEPSGLKLVGGRLLPGPFGPAAFCMYEGPSGERF